MSHNPFGDPSLNPYDAPQQTDYMQSQQPTNLRPTSATVFGVLNIVFGIICILVVIGSLVVLAATNSNPVLDRLKQNSFSNFWSVFEIAVKFFGAVVLLASGVGLAQMKSYGRTLAIVWGAYGIVFSIVRAVVNVAILMPAMNEAFNLGPANRGMSAGFAMGGMIGAVLMMIYPTIVLIFMMNRNFTDAFKNYQEHGQRFQY